MFVTKPLSESKFTTTNTKIIFAITYWGFSNTKMFNSYLTLKNYRLENGIFAEYENISSCLPKFSLIIVHSSQLGQ